MHAAVEAMFTKECLHYVNKYMHPCLIQVFESPTVNFNFSPIIILENVRFGKISKQLLLMSLIVTFNACITVKAKIFTDLFYRLGAKTVMIL